MDETRDDRPSNRLTAACARALKNDLRAALTAYASGQGRIEAVLNEIERVTQYVTGKHNIQLGSAERPMRQFVRRHAPGRLKDAGLPGIKWKDLYNTVRHARNDLAHTGAEAALAGTRTAAMAAVLIEALTQAATRAAKRKMRDVMVSNPTCVHTWQTLADVRRTMLVNDFSVLPLSCGHRNGKWRSVRAESLAGYLAAGDGSSRSERLADAIESGASESLLSSLTTFDLEAPVEAIWSESGLNLPIVVTTTTGDKSNETEIAGIVTAFDLL